MLIMIEHALNMTLKTVCQSIMVHLSCQKNNILSWHVGKICYFRLEKRCIFAQSERYLHAGKNIISEGGRGEENMILGKCNPYYVVKLLKNDYFSLQSKRIGSVLLWLKSAGNPPPSPNNEKVKIEKRWNVQIWFFFQT